MPSPIDELIRRRVIEQWLTGEARDKIASDLQIGTGTVSGIVSEYKKDLQDSNIDSVRELVVEARKQGFSVNDLASHIRLHNFFIESWACEEKLESFITNVSSNDIPPERVIELVNQLHEILKTEPIPFDQIPRYIERKLEEKQKIDEQIKQADATLQSKNVNIEAINEHIQLNEELSKHRLSTRDIHKLLNLLLAAKKYKYDPGKIVAKLRNIKRLENKENKLKNSCEALSNKGSKYKEVILDLHIGKSELISFKIVLHEAIETYRLTPSTAALHVINIIKDHNKKGQLKHELSELSFQKYAISQYCSSRSQIIMALMNLRSHGITDEQILLYASNLLEKKL